MIMSQLGGSDYVPGTTPPAGPPTNGNLFTYAGGALIGLYWTKGDAFAETQIAYALDPTTPTSTDIVDKVAPGVTNWDTGVTSDDRCYWYVRHLRGGVTTAWERCEHSLGCVQAPPGP